MNGTSYDMFATTMAHFERAFQVRHIATSGLSTCAPDDDMRQVFVRYPDFDQIPVVETDRVIGILERTGDEPSGSVRSQMRMLDESLLVAADAPINRVLPLLGEPRCYRLVLEGARINGIITRSDLLKLPVRLYTFGVVTHLETIMAQIVEQKHPGDIWLGELKKGRRKKLEEKQTELQQQRVEPPLLELLEFCDKRDIVRTLLDLPKKFKEEVGDIEQLRNQVAHAANYAANDDELAKFIKRLERAHYWIEQLHQQLAGE